MRVLALDTTARTASSVALIVDGRVIVERAGAEDRSQAERFPADVLAVLADAGLSLTDIDLFAVASGPGSFTGIRIGIATVQGLALARQRPVAPVSALRALAERAASGRPAGSRIGAWMDAHRRDVFTALYDVTTPATETEPAVLTEVEEPRAGAPGDTVQRWTGLGLPAAIAGDGAALYRHLISDAVVVVPHGLLAGALGRIAGPMHTAGHSMPPAGVQPLYVRRPDVEVARDAARQAQ